MNSRIPQIIQQLKQQGTPLKKLQVALKVDEMLETLEAQGLNLNGLQSWLNQAPELFLKYQEKTENRCNLRDLQEWLNCYWDHPKNVSSVHSPKTLPLETFSTQPSETPSITNTLPTNSQKEIPQKEVSLLPKSTPSFTETSALYQESTSGPEIEILPPLSEKTNEEEEEDWDRILKELEDLETAILEESSSSKESHISSVETSITETSEWPNPPEPEPDFYYFLRRKKDIQGPYHFTRVLRYIREGRLPKGVEFSLDREHWSQIEQFPHKSDIEEIQLYESPDKKIRNLSSESPASSSVTASPKETQRLKKETKDVKKESLIPEEFWLRMKEDIQGPYHYKRILRYIREGRLPNTVEFSFDRQKWEEIDFFPYSLDEAEIAQAASLHAIELSQKSSPKKHETGLLNADDGDYQGEFQDDLPHGQGDIKYPDGSTYSGGFRSGKFNGRGCFTFPDGGKYEGDWFDGNMNGLGKLIDAEGNVYNGRWVHGEQTGLGTLTNAEGLSYVGEFKDGKFHGWGTYTWPTGQTYVGEFYEGEFHGEGTLTIPTLFGKKTQAGLWEYGDYVGPTKEFAEATKTYKREARLGNKLAQKRLKELGIKWNY